LQELITAGKKVVSCESEVVVTVLEGSSSDSSRSLMERPVKTDNKRENTAAFDVSK